MGRAQHKHRNTIKPRRLYTHPIPGFSSIARPGAVWAPPWQSVSLTAEMQAGKPPVARPEAWSVPYGLALPGKLRRRAGYVEIKASSNVHTQGLQPSMQAQLANGCGCGQVVVVCAVGADNSFNYEFRTLLVQTFACGRQLVYPPKRHHNGPIGRMPPSFLGL